jgi:cytochrome b6-f complex iron-sulfur subunit
MSEREPEEALARRRLFLLLGGCLGLTTLPSGCAREAPPKPGQVSLPLSELEGDRRVVVVVLGNPVEVSRSGDSVVARSLLCTHTGCVVKWRADRNEYLCPCHEGRYDAEGNVISGSPPKPLPKLPVRIAGGNALIGG